MGRNALHITAVKDCQKSSSGIRRLTGLSRQNAESRRDHTSIDHYRNAHAQLTSCLRLFHQLILQHDRQGGRQCTHGHVLALLLDLRASFQEQQMQWKFLKVFHLCHVLALLQGLHASFQKRQWILIVIQWPAQRSRRQQQESIALCEFCFGCTSFHNLVT